MIPMFRNEEIEAEERKASEIISKRDPSAAFGLPPPDPSRYQTNNTMTTR